ncbi:MAG TPA: DUF3160 domain-containing protein [Anaerolineaceae bacterium]|nr:DUF3160 domain-containing protein [Anaerolineaceae bacterium]
MSNKPSTRTYLIVACVLLFSISCQAVNGIFAAKDNTPGETPAATTAPEPTSQATDTAEPAGQPTSAAEEPPVITGNVYPAAFSTYPAISANIPNQDYGGYSLPIDLGSVAGLDQLELSDAQRALLEQNGFVVAEPVTGEYQEFYQVYESYRYASLPMFVTTDSIFHVYHLVFDKMLRDLERDSFIPMLNDLTTTLFATSVQQMQALAGTPLEDQARRNVAYFGVAARVLELPVEIPAEVSAMVDAEVAAIEAHAGPAISAIWDRPDLPEDKKLIEDYSQYVPRGHYTRSDELKRYFKAMMWYGRMTLRGRDAFETQRALLMVQTLRSTTTASGASAVDVWAKIYDPTAFIVGKSDDLSFHEYGALSDQIFGAAPDLQAFGDATKTQQFMEAVRQLPPPQINSMWVWIWEDKEEATQGFRLMGQRFTLDAYVFGQVIWRNVGTTDNPRMLPKGMDFMAAMGSQEAFSILDEMGETGYANYEQQMAKVKEEISGLEIDSWTQNLYWSWLYAFQPVIAVKDNRFPAFMRTQAWIRKDLNTALGSWTELKHDTILYAKQVMAEMGGGDAGEPPRGFVEPNPEAFARMLALTEMTSSGLDQRGLLSEYTRANLVNLADLITFLKSISEKELNHEAISEDEYTRIRFIGGEMEGLTLASSDRESNDGSYRDLSDQKAALIADVATGADPNGGLVALEEAIGEPAVMYVVLPDDPYRVAIGAVFSYYEFNVSAGDRMTDEAWQQMIAEGSQPAAPGWTQMFIAK